MYRRFSLLTLALVLASVPSTLWAGNEEAAVVLLDNEQLCLRIGRSDPSLSETRAHVLGRALARENVAIATELLERRGASNRRAALVRDVSELERRGDHLVREVFKLERRICGAGVGWRGDISALGEQLHSAARQLEKEMRIEGRRRSAILRSFLDRREAATYAALEQAGLAEPDREASGGSRPVQEKDVASHSQRESRRSAPVVPEARRSPAGAGAAVPGQPKGIQIWHPSPQELADRRQREASAFRTRFLAWSPAYRREMQELAGLRSVLARELEARSLKSSRSLCMKLTATVERIEYEVVLAAPDSSLREYLVRMLGSYATAGRWCASGRFAYAWIEIEKADRRWQQISSQLRVLSAG